MLSEKIKKIIYILLLSLVVYLFFLIIPKLTNIFNFIFDIIKPFLIAFILSFLLHPLVSFIQKYVKKRGIAVIIVLILFSVLIIIFIKYISNILIFEFEHLSVKMPEIIKELENILNKLLSSIPIFKNYSISLEDLINKNGNIIQDTIFTSETLNKLLNSFKYILITPIILIYLLLDYEKIINGIRQYLINNKKEKFKNYLGELNKTMSSYIRGVLLVMFILFTIFTIVFSILDVENAMVFALIMAITNVIPYLGSWIGTSLPVLYVLLTSYKKAIIVLVVCIIIQTLEADFLTPLVQGKKTKLHPLIIVLSLLFFGSLFGFIGMLIAVPMAAIINITLKYYPINNIIKLIN